MVTSVLLSVACPQEARLEILKALGAGVPMATEVELEQLAAATGGFTGADLRALLYNAQLEAVHSNMRSSSPHVRPSGRREFLLLEMEQLCLSFCVRDRTRS